MTISIQNTLPDVVAVTEKLHSLIYSDIIAVQPTTNPVAAVYSLQLVDGVAGEYSEKEFKLRRNNHAVDSVKLKTNVSNELREDMSSMGLVANKVIESVLLSDLADEINTSILDKHRKISKTSTDISLTSTSKFDTARELYAQVHIKATELERSTGTPATYVIAANDAFDLLFASGMCELLDNDTYLLASGLILIHDRFSNESYITIGVKKTVADIEISSLIYSPYYIDETYINYLNATDAKSLNENVGLVARHAFTAPSLSSDSTDIDWSNLGVLANSSEFSLTCDLVISS